MNIEIERQEDLAIVSLPASLQHLLPESAEEASRKLVGLIEDPAVNKMVIDLNELEYGGTPVLALLVQVYLKAKRRQKHLRICQVHPYVEEVLKKTRLDHLLEIFASRDDALNGL
jgi:anti-anti-sigma factor